MKQNIIENGKKLIFPIIFLIIGVLFIIFSDTVTEYIVMALGSLLLIYGLSIIFTNLFYKRSFANIIEKYKTIASIIIGLLSIIFASNIADLLMIFAGFYIVLSSLISFYTTWKFYPKSKEKNIQLIFIGFELAIGLVLSFSPGESLSFICILIGAYLIYKSIITIINTLFFKKEKNYGFFYTNYKYEETKKHDPNIIDHDDIKDDQILKK